jgi:hypothetical protein
MILHRFRAGSPVVTDTGCCLPAARPRRPRPSGPQPLIGVPGRLQRGRPPHQGRPATQQGPQQLGQSGRIDLVVLEPGRGDYLTAAGMHQMRFRLQLHQPTPAGGSLERDRGVRRQPTQDWHQLGRIVGEVAVAGGRRPRPPWATWEHLRWTSISTYTVVRASSLVGDPKCQPSPSVPDPRSRAAGVLRREPTRSRMAWPTGGRWDGSGG